MTIGAGIFLITLGAILAFAVRDDSGRLDLNVVGVIVMLAGAAGIWLSYHLTNRRRRVRTDAIDPAAEEEYRTIQETHHQEIEQEDRPGERTVDLDPAASDLPRRPTRRTRPRRM